MNLDGAVTPLDALVVINHLNAHGASMPDGTPPSIDVNHDNQASPLDALLVINHINSGRGEGESPVRIAGTHLSLALPSSGSEASTTSAMAFATQRGPAAETAVQAGAANLRASMPWQLLPERVHNRLVNLAFENGEGHDLAQDLLDIEWIRE